MKTYELNPTTVVLDPPILPEDDLLLTHSRLSRKRRAKSVPLS